MAESTRETKVVSSNNNLTDEAVASLLVVLETGINKTDGIATEEQANHMVYNSTTDKENDVNSDERGRCDTQSEEIRDVPIDRGWAWVVVAACFFMHVLVLGSIKSFGVLFMEFRDKYGVTARELGMMQGVAMTMMLALGLGANVLAVRFTSQKVVFIGGILSGLGFVLSACVPSFNLLYLTYGVIAGLGFAMSYSPSVVMVAIHFKKRRSLANGISLSGSGVGSFILPNLIRCILKEYGLSGCLLLLGGLMLNVCVCGLLYRPLTNYRKRNQEKMYSNDVKDNRADQRHLMKDGDKKEALHDDSSNLQVKSKQTGEDNLLKPNLQLKVTSEFSSSEYMPISSLQSISQKEMKNISNGLCCKLKCSKCKRKSKKQRPRQGPKLFNWSLLSNQVFLIYAASCALGNFAYPNIFLMLPAYAESNGQDRDTAALLISIIGITDLVGRLFFGWFSDLKLFPRRYGFIGCMAISAFFNLVAPAMKSFIGLVIYAALYGLFAGSYLALISVMLADSLGSYLCRECGKTFNYQSNFCRHKSRVHDSRKYRCLLCDRSYTQTTNLNIHHNKNHDSYKKSVLKESRLLAKYRPTDSSQDPVKDLDSEIQSVLGRHNLLLDEKTNLYNKTFQKYLNFLEQSIQ